MSIDPPKSAPKLQQNDTNENSPARRYRELLELNNRVTWVITNLDVPLREPTNHCVLAALDVEIAALRAKLTDARHAENQLRHDLAVQAASHDVQLSECRALLARCQADLARSQAENTDLRREIDVTTDDLHEARQQLGENEYEIAMLRRRLELPQRPSPLDLN